MGPLSRAWIVTRSQKLALRSEEGFSTTPRVSVAFGLASELKERLLWTMTISLCVISSSALLLSIVFVSSKAIFGFLAFKMGRLAWILGGSYITSGISSKRSSALAGEKTRLSKLRVFSLMMLSYDTDWRTSGFESIGWFRISLFISDSFRCSILSSDALKFLANVADVLLMSSFDISSDFFCFPFLFTLIRVFFKGYFVTAL